MLYYLDGVVSHMEPQLAVLDVGGVGFACRVSLQTQARLKKGEAARLFTLLHVREDAMDIYGFYDPEERSCYKMLTAISGVGPKAALSILSAVSPERLALAVLSGDERALLSASGVGKKLSQRILLELKDKMGKGQSQATAGVSSAELPIAGKLSEAQAALMVLGYSPTEAAMALKDLDENALSVEQMIRLGLKNLAPM